MLSRLRAALRAPFAPINRWVSRVVHTTPYIHGNAARLVVGKRTSLVNTVFNTASGCIYLGDDVIFGHNCMVLTGRHDFEQGMRKRLSVGLPDTPTAGYDVRIGDGCWIASGAVIIGGVSIGKHVVVAAGAVVTRNVPDHSMVAGIPARIVGTTLGRSERPVAEAAGGESR